jgi:hypothetical protein
MNIPAYYSVLRLLLFCMLEVVLAASKPFTMSRSRKLGKSVASIVEMCDQTKLTKSLPGRLHRVSMRGQQIPIIKIVEYSTM